MLAYWLYIKSAYMIPTIHTVNTKYHIGHFFTITHSRYLSVQVWGMHCELIVFAVFKPDCRYTIHNILTISCQEATWWYLQWIIEEIL